MRVFLLLFPLALARGGYGGGIVPIQVTILPLEFVVLSPYTTYSYAP